MHVPDSLVTLHEEGLIDEVVRPLMSGKEAQVFLVRVGGTLRVAKVYKEAHNRSFRQRAEYLEGRKVRNTRDQRAMAKRTRHGQEQDEAAWRSAEVDVIYRLRAAGVRVPAPHQFVDGVLIMELITDAEGRPAPRLGDVVLERAEAEQIFEQLLSDVVRMLCAGVVHGDLSNFNVLIGADGPVIIDFPQAVNASSNQNARKLLLRDVDNLQRFLAGYVPEAQPLAYGQELWHLYERGELTPDTRLTGRFARSERKADTRQVLDLIADAEHDRRRQQRGQGHKPNGRGAGRGPVVEVRRSTPLAAHAAGSGGSTSRPPSLTSSHTGPRTPQPAPQRSQPVPQRSQPVPQRSQPAPQRSQPAPQRSQPAPQKAPQHTSRAAFGSVQQAQHGSAFATESAGQDSTAAQKKRRRRRRRKGRAPEQTTNAAQPERVHGGHSGTKQHGRNQD